MKRIKGVFCDPVEALALISVTTLVALWLRFCTGDLKLVSSRH